MTETMPASTRALMDIRARAREASHVACQTRRNCSIEDVDRGRARVAGALGTMTVFIEKVRG